MQYLLHQEQYHLMSFSMMGVLIMVHDRNLVKRMSRDEFIGPSQLNTCIEC